MFTEVWLHPQDYILECTMIVVGCVIVTILTMRTPKKPSELEAS